MAPAMPGQQRAQPIHPVTRRAVAPAPAKKRDILCLRRQSRATVTRPIVDHQKMRNPPRPVVRQEIGQARGLIAKAGEQQNRARANGACAVGQRRGPKPLRQARHSSLLRRDTNR